MSSESIKTEKISFENLNLIEPILKAINLEGYTNPTPIQKLAIPIVLNKKDLLGIAQTGTGKTAAFAIPIIQLMHLDEKSVDFKNRKIRCLIITPTRELALQVFESFKTYGKYTNLKCAVLIGGVNQHHQVLTLKKGVDVLISTTGRLIDLINQNYVSVDNVEYFVIDEADTMMDMGFIHDVKMIVSDLPKDKQTLFFSATMPNEIEKLSNLILKNPEKIEIEPESKTAEKISQFIYFVDKINKKMLLLDILKSTNTDRILIFTRTKHGANNLVEFLIKSKINAAAIHSDKSQNARQTALNNFKDKITKVLVATDIASRGIDIEELNLVINFDIPNIPETYIHRIGRTGRAGTSGKAVSLCDNDERAYLNDIEKLIGKAIPILTNEKYPLMNKSVNSNFRKTNNTNQNAASSSKIAALKTNPTAKFMNPKSNKLNNNTNQKRLAKRR